MTGSIMSEKVRMHLGASRTGFSLLLGQNTADAADEPAWRSALQNPDLSRSRLESILRRVGEARTGADKGGKSYWDAFIAHCQSSRANSNTDEHKEIS